MAGFFFDSLCAVLFFGWLFFGWLFFGWLFFGEDFSEEECFVDFFEPPEFDFFEPPLDFFEPCDPPPPDPPLCPPPPLVGRTRTLATVTTAGAEVTEPEPPSISAANHSNAAPPTIPQEVRTARSTTGTTARKHRMPIEAIAAI